MAQEAAGGQPGIDRHELVDGAWQLLLRYQCGGGDGASGDEHREVVVLLQHLPHQSEHGLRLADAGGMQPDELAFGTGLSGIAETLAQTDEGFFAAGGAFEKPEADQRRQQEADEAVEQANHAATPQAASASAVRWFSAAVRWALAAARASASLSGATVMGSPMR